MIPGPSPTHGQNTLTSCHTLASDNITTSCYNIPLVYDGRSAQIALDTDLRPVSSLTINLSSCRICVMLGSLLILTGLSVSAFMTDIRWLFLTYAVITGLGEGMVYTGSQVVLGFYFPQHASVANGVGMVGVALATFVFPPLSQFLLDHYGLDGCLLLIGALGFQATVFGALMRPCDIERRVCEMNNSGKTLLKRISSSIIGNVDNVGNILQPSFLLFLFSAFCFCIGNYITYLFLPDYFIKQGSGPKEASLLLSVVGIGGAVSRTLSGFAANDDNIGPLILYSGTYGLVAVLDFLITPMTSTLGGKIAYAFMFGLYASPGWVLLSPITLRIVGVRNLASAFGIVMFACGLGILIGPPLAGLIAESYGKYQGGFYFAGSSFCVTCGSGLIIALLWKQNRNDELEKKGEEAELQSMISGDVSKSQNLDSITLIIKNPNENSNSLSTLAFKAPMQSLNDL